MTTTKQTNRELIKEYLFQKLHKVMKQPYGNYKFPFVDPGSDNYDGNLWDWDTYWAIYAMIGVEENCDDIAPDFKERLIECGKGNVRNFLNFQLEDGYIPMMIMEPYSDNPYLLKKHKEGAILNMHKPFLCQQICIVSGYSGSYEWIKEHIPALKKYFECYDRYYYNEKCGLYVWADDVMIGVDNDPSTFGRPRFSTASIFLNSFLCPEFRAMARICREFGLDDDYKYYMDKSVKLTEAIQNECYDKRDKMFYNVDVDIKCRPYDWFHKGLGVFWNTLFIKVRCWSNFLPMLVGIPTQEQAEELKNHIMDENTFLSPHGVRSLSIDEKMYNLEASGNPSNWLGPIWIIAQYCIFRGLMNYGFKKEAEIICERTLNLLGDDIRKTGNLHECYNPETSEPICHPGFVNWNILAINMADELSGKPSPARFLD